MGKLLGIDYGKKKVGFAISDSLKISTNPLGTIPVHEVWKFIDKQIETQEIETIVVGYAKHKDGKDAESMQYIHPFVRGLKKKYKKINIEFEDESYTSVMASQSLIDSGAKKSTRRNKELVDTISAMLILQSFIDRTQKKESENQ
jgi:putative Holliday junction resolvase